MLHLEIKEYYYKKEEENIVFHPVVVKIPTFAKDIDVLEFRLRNTLSINRQLYEALTDCIAEKVNKKLKKRGKK